MWVLLLVMTGLSSGVTPIVTFDTLRGCEDERIRLTEEFDKVYTERNYQFTCQPVRRGQK